MEKIAMKCTRAEYESIKEFVGELTNPSKDDFKSYNYLTNCSSKKTVYMISKGFVDHDKKIYETFDKDVFLKASGIVPKIAVGIIKQAILIDVIKSTEKRKEDSFWSLNMGISKETIKSLRTTVSNVEINLLDVEEALGKDTIVAINTRVKKGKRKKMFKKTIKLLKSFDELNFDINIIDTQYGYGRNAEGEHERDGSFTITIKGNKTK